MEYTMLRNSDLKVSRLCMGGCPMGGYGWGDTQENELIEAVHTAVDQGVNFFDTADTYGLGQSEKTLGKALGSHRKDVVIASKFGVRIENGKTFYDNSSSWIKEAVEGSLRRLGTDYIDLYQIHYRDGKTPIRRCSESSLRLRHPGQRKTPYRQAELRIRLQVPHSPRAAQRVPLRKHSLELHQHFHPFLRE